MPKALARALAQRCHELRQHGLDAAAAETRAFEEFLHHRPVGRSIEPNLYEEFLDAYAPEQRRARGVYYTPAAVVGAQVRLAADLLEQRFGCQDRFGDDRIVVVDPAAGSGAYPLAVVCDALAHGQVIEHTLTGRMRLFEPQAGAACLARAQGLNVQECDVLAAPIALDGPLVVCLGNPPYRRAQRQLRSDLVEDFREPGAGVHLKNLYNEYVYFWRWAIRTVFEQRRGPGIVSFVSASSFVRGPGFGGMRRLLRRTLDELWIVDLEGDHLAARRTDNVFPIRTPVAIAMGVRYAAARPDELPLVHYTRLTGSRLAKLAQLDNVRGLTDLTWQVAANEWGAPLVPRPRGVYQTWPKLTELFPWQLSGAQLKRTWPIGATPELLRARWRHLLTLLGSERAAAFGETRDRGLDSTPPDLRDPSHRLEPLRALRPGDTCVEPARYAHRSFDRQWVLPDARLGDFMRPALWRVAGPRQIFLTSLLTNVLGAGPAAVATALVPDLDHFRGSFGARGVIPLWRDAQASVPNVDQAWLERLCEHYGASIDAETLLAYCYALLATRGYVRRFEDELRSPGPRVPFPRDAALFWRAARLGRRLLWVHTFGERCVPSGHAAGRVPIGVARWIEPPAAQDAVAYDYDPGRQRLRVGTGLFGPVASAVWAYSVSGMRVLPSWLRRRISPAPKRKSLLDAIRPREWTPSLSCELLELIWVLEATLALEPALEAVLDEIASGGGHVLGASSGDE